MAGVWHLPIQQKAGQLRIALQVRPLVPEAAESRNKIHSSCWKEL